MRHRSTFICPYCFEKHKLSDVQFNSDSKHKDLCPSCNNRLPEGTLHGKQIIISVVGQRTSGKSCFIATLVNKLLHQNEAFITIPFGDSGKKFHESYFEPLFANNTVLCATVNNNEPLIFTLMRKNNSIFGKRTESITLVICDVAGEGGCWHFDDAKSQTSQCVANSNAIIVMLDPLLIPSVTKQLDNEVAGNSTDYNKPDTYLIDLQNEIISHLSDSIKIQCGISYTKIIEVPVAVVVSKLDAIKSLIPSNFTVLNQNHHINEMSLDITDLNNVNSEIRELLYSWDADSLECQLETNYSRYSHFAISALGLNNNPDKFGKIECPCPHRVEDPFLWILKENGVINEK